MKKLIAVVLCSIFFLLLVSCGKDDATGSSGSGGTSNAWDSCTWDQSTWGE